MKQFLYENYHLFFPRDIELQIIWDNYEVSIWNKYVQSVAPIHKKPRLGINLTFELIIIASFFFAICNPLPYGI